MKWRDHPKPGQVVTIYEAGDPVPWLVGRGAPNFQIVDRGGKPYPSMPEEAAKEEEFWPGHLPYDPEYVVTSDDSPRLVTCLEIFEWFGAGGYVLSLKGTARLWAFVDQHQVTDVEQIGLAMERARYDLVRWLKTPAGRKLTPTQARSAKVVQQIQIEVDGKSLSRTFFAWAK